jgi:hypothetical protein
MTYGYVAQEHDDRIIDAAKRINKLGAETYFPGPLLNYLPFRMYCNLACFTLGLTNHVPFRVSASHPRMGPVP